MRTYVARVDVYSNKNREFCSGPAREHECNCKLGHELYRSYHDKPNVMIAYVGGRQICMLQYELSIHCIVAEQSMN